MRRKGGTGIGEAIGSIVARLDKKGGLTSARFAASWPKVVGPEIEAHTSGLYVRGSELVVRVDSAVWAHELQAMSEHILEQMRLETGQSKVETIRFYVTHKVAQDRAQAIDDERVTASDDTDKVESVPLTQAEREQVLRSVEAIKDPELRAIAQRATIRDLEWKKGLARRANRTGRDKG